MDLKYVGAARRLLPDPPERSDANLLLMDAQEKARGVRFPAAVREWYALEDADQLLRTYSNADFPTPVQDLGNPMEDWYGEPSRDLAAEGILHVLNENQGYCDWGVALDGSDDPPVLVSFEGGPWLRHCARFSDFVWTRLWDHGEGPVAARGSGSEEEGARAVRAAAGLESRPPTSAWPRPEVLRFEGPGGARLRVELGGGGAAWHVNAPDAAAFEAAARLWIGAGLALDPVGGAAEAPLRRLRGG